jgi:hypothetical protein
MGVPTAPVPGTKPSTVTVYETFGGKVFFGDQGINAPAAPITMKVRAQDIVFQGANPNSISVGSNVLIVAGATGITIQSLDLTDPAAVAQFVSLQNTPNSGVTGALTVLGGVAVGGSLNFIDENHTE